MYHGVIIRADKSRYNPLMTHETRSIKYYANRNSMWGVVYMVTVGKRACFMRDTLCNYMT